VKYAVVILDGAAVAPPREAESRTALETARLPAIAALAERGHVGAVAGPDPEATSDREVALQELLTDHPRRGVASGVRGAMLTTCDAAARVGSRLGWERLQLPFLTPGETAPRAMAVAAAAALGSFDLVCCHVQSPPAPSHEDGMATAVAHLESVDRWLIAPLAAALEKFGDPSREAGAEGWRVMVVCTPRAGGDGAVGAILMAGAWVRSVVARPFHERSAVESDLRIVRPGETMEYFLRGGLAFVPKGLVASRR
jgi:hypothetical protein